MLGTSNVYPTIAVKNLDEAKAFYEGKLGLTKDSENPGGVFYKSGDTQVFIYPSEFAGSNKATYASWKVDSLEAVIEELKTKDIVFEHYDDMPGVTLEGDIHVMGELRAAWFKDPDGNILNIVSSQG